MSNTLLISEYVEGSSWNKAIELFNYGAGAIDLAESGYSLQLYHNGKSSEPRSVPLQGIVPAGGVYVVAHPRAESSILAIANQTHGYLAFNGDDAVGLAREERVRDLVGIIGNDPGSEWGTGLRSTKDNTLRRLANDGTTPSPSTSFSLDSGWGGYTQDNISHLGLAPGKQPPAELLLTKYEEGEGQNQSLEIKNLSEDDIDLSEAAIEIAIHENGSIGPSRLIPLEGSIAAGGTFTISNSGAVDFLKEQSQQLSPDLYFDGNDAIAITQGVEIIDSFGSVLFGPGDLPWGDGNFVTRDNTLRRKATVTIPDQSISDIFYSEIEWISVGQAFVISPEGDQFSQDSFPGTFKDLDSLDDGFKGDVAIKSYNATENLIELASTNAGVDKPVHIVTGTSGPFNPPLSRPSRPSYLETPSPGSNNQPNSNGFVYPEFTGVVTGGRTDGNYQGWSFANDPTVRGVGIRNLNEPSNPERTWVVIHGWNDNPTSPVSYFRELIPEMANQSRDRVIALDWQEAAAEALGLNRLNAFVGAASWITPVAEFAARALYTEYGLTGGEINLVGHSLGSFVAAEIGRIYKEGLSVRGQKYRANGCKHYRVRG